MTPAAFIRRLLSLPKPRIVNIRAFAGERQLTYMARIRWLLARVNP